VHTAAFDLDGDELDFYDQLTAMSKTSRSWPLR